MAKVVWPQQAIDDLDRISDYIDRFDPAAARRVRSRLTAMGESLAEFPNRGRPTKSGARELTTVPPFVLQYAVTNDVVVIVHIRHGRRRPLAD